MLTVNDDLDSMWVETIVLF